MKTVIKTTAKNGTIQYLKLVKEVREIWVSDAGSASDIEPKTARDYINGKTAMASALGGKVEVMLVVVSA